MCSPLDVLLGVTRKDSIRFEDYIKVEDAIFQRHQDRQYSDVTIKFSIPDEYLWELFDHLQAMRDRQNVLHKF